MSQVTFTCLNAHHISAAVLMRRRAVLFTLPFSGISEKGSIFTPRFACSPVAPSARRPSFIPVRHVVLPLQDVPIEVDENGTLDLSMKKSKDSGKGPLDDSLSLAEAAKGGGVLVGPAFYQPLCERDGWDGPLPLHFNKAHVSPDAEVQSDARHNRRPKSALDFTGIYCIFTIYFINIFLLKF